MIPVCLTALRRVGAADAAPPTKQKPNTKDPRLEKPRELVYEHYQYILEEEFHEPCKGKKQIPTTKILSNWREERLEDCPEINDKYAKAIRGDRDYAITDEITNLQCEMFVALAEAIEECRVQSIEWLLGLKNGVDGYIRGRVAKAKRKYIRDYAPRAVLAIYPDESVNSKRKLKGQRKYPKLYKQQPKDDDLETFGFHTLDSDVEVRDTVEAAVRLVTPDDEEIIVDYEALHLLRPALGRNGEQIVKALWDGANIGEAGKLLSRRKRQALNL